MLLSILALKNSTRLCFKSVFFSSRSHILSLIFFVALRNWKKWLMDWKQQRKNTISSRRSIASLTEGHKASKPLRINRDTGNFLCFFKFRAKNVKVTCWSSILLQRKKWWWWWGAGSRQSRKNEDYRRDAAAALLRPPEPTGSDRDSLSRTGGRVDAVRRLRCRTHDRWRHVWLCPRTPQCTHQAGGNLGLRHEAVLGGKGSRTSRDWKAPPLMDVTSSWLDLTFFFVFFRFDLFDSFFFFGLPLGNDLHRPFYFGTARRFIQAFQKSGPNPDLYSVCSSSLCLPFQNSASSINQTGHLQYDSVAWEDSAATTKDLLGDEGRRRW